MKTRKTLGLSSAIASVYCLGLLSGCATSESGSESAAELADTEAVDETGDDAPVDENDTDADTEPGNDDGETGEVGETDDAGETGETGEVEGETDDGGETGGDTDGTTGGEEPPMAELDGDSEMNPAVHVQFRVTSPAPISVDTPLFNDEAIDTLGLQYQGEVSNPGDQYDFVVFNIVPGQVDPYINIFLDCGQPGLGPDSIRAHLFHEDGTLLDTIACGDDEQILLEDANSIDYLVRVEVRDGNEQFDTYSLEINGHCFQECNFQPYEG